VEAEAELRRALVIQQDVLGPEHPNLENTLNSLAVVLLSQHKYAEAEQAQRASIRILEAIFDPDDPKLAAARENLGSILAAQRP
jgi:hypothetical protein